MSRPQSRFTPQDATATMMERMREDSDSITTHQLAKGSIDSTSPARSGSTHGSWPFDPSGASRSPDGRSLASHLQPLQSIGIIEFFEQDDRPTFIVDLSNPTNFSPGQLAILYSNATVRASQLILDLLSPDTSDPDVSNDFERFRAWIVSHAKDGLSTEVSLPSISYGDVTWTCSTLRKRYRVVTGSDERVGGPTPDPTPDIDPSTPRESVANEGDYFGSVQRAPLQEKLSQSPDSMNEDQKGEEAGLHMAEASGELGQPSFDWTRIAVHSGLPPHVLFARSVDWAATPLGPIEHWPADLRTMSNLIMGSPNPAAMYWGTEFTSIYNEAYCNLAGQKHPRMMGAGYKDVWTELWDAVEPVFDSAWNWGQATMKTDDRLFVVRNGFLEETYFDWSIIPLVGGDGNVVALYNPAFENTRRKVNERRMFTLREVNEKTAPATNIKSFWNLALQGLEFNPYDIPFVMIYSTTSDESESEVSSLHSGSLANPPTVILEGALGVPSDHPTAVKRLDLRTSDEGFAPYMRESMSRNGAPVVLTRAAGSFPKNLTEGFEWRGFGDPCRTIVIFPVHPTPTGDAVAGFIVMGTNPRRPYNEDFDLFIQLLSRSLSSAMAQVALFEEEIRKGQKAARIAALDRQELSLQLRLRTQEAVESEYKFSRMAEFAPVGMFITNHLGKITYCNDMWWQISRHPRSHDTLATWMQSVREEDRPALEAVWAQLVTDKVVVTHEFRFQSASQAEGHPVDTWVLMSAFPEKDAAGDLKRIFGCLTDITQQKWAETFQRQRREEAVELKRQQENFIDMTSHEMRNPLSAILQCADEITSGLARFRKIGAGGYSEADIHLLVDGCIEAASTISLCASHQKRIVDDILTFSKLDSQLLIVTPVDSRPIATVQNVLKMFESEIKSNDIYLEFRIEKSYEELEVDWVKIDPSRLRQVLINLMTNAIKFTGSSRDNPTILVSLGASRDRGDGLAPGGLDYIPSRSPDAHVLTDGPEWGTGDKIFLHFSVTDTGPGLDAKEKKLLFQRFSQASPRTHVQYGGFGLGLYICRTLSELQGGQISVASEKGVGSTFAFYIKARKVEPGRLSPSAQAMFFSPSSPFRPVLSSGGGGLSTEWGRNPSTTVHYSIPNSTTPASTSNDASKDKSSVSATPVLQPASGAVVLPTYQRDSVAAANAMAAAARSSPVHGGAAHGQKMQPLDVLIVEDNVVNQRVLQRQLIRCGNNTLVANHGKEALAALRRSRFWRSPPPPREEPVGTEEGLQQRPQLVDGAKTVSEESIASTQTSSSTSTSLTSGTVGRGVTVLESNINISVILMDLEMPVMDGMTCARRIRELEREGVIAHHIPIIAVTAYARPEQIETAKAAGIDDVISKPFRIPELIPKIEELVTKYNMHGISEGLQTSQAPPITATAAA